jgi:hypothetical protein
MSGVHVTCVYECFIELELGCTNMNQHPSASSIQFMDSACYYCHYY